MVFFQILTILELIEKEQGIIENAHQKIIYVRIITSKLGVNNGRHVINLAAIGWFA